jgi:hypothetical protein
MPPAERAHEIVLVHIENESAERSTVLRSQLAHDYLALIAKHGVPVLPIALYLNVGLKGVGIDVYERNLDEFNVLSFRYFYVGLPALDAVEYIEGGNVLGAALAGRHSTTSFRSWSTRPAIIPVGISCIKVQSIVSGQGPLCPAIRPRRVTIPRLSDLRSTIWVQFM